MSKTGKVTKQQRQTVWEELQEQARQGKTRPFCRQINDKGLMFAGAGPSVFMLLGLTLIFHLGISCSEDLKGANKSYDEISFPNVECQSGNH